MLWLPWPGTCSHKYWHPWDFCRNCCASSPSPLPTLSHGVTPSPVPPPVCPCLFTHPITYRALCPPICNPSVPYLVSHLCSPFTCAFAFASPHPALAISLILPDDNDNVITTIVQLSHCHCHHCHNCLHLCPCHCHWQYYVGYIVLYTV